MADFSIFQLCQLKTLNFSSHHHFWWFSGPFKPFFLKNGKKSEFQLFWLIFRKMAPAMPKWPSETPGMGQMASFGMVFNPKMYGRIFEKVFRESSKSHRQPILQFPKMNMAPLDYGLFRFVHLRNFQKKRWHK